MVMKVMIDNVWATPSNLHVRVTVWEDGKWRHKYNVTCPISEIPDEAVAAAWTPVAPGRASGTSRDIPLF